ncbi:hypothetical protein D3C85_1187610 [compost metagenome]
MFATPTKDINEQCPHVIEWRINLDQYRTVDLQCLLHQQGLLQKIKNHQRSHFSLLNHNIVWEWVIVDQTQHSLAEMDCQYLDHCSLLS